MSLSRNVLVYLDTLEPIRKLFQFLWKMFSPSRNIYDSPQTFEPVQKHSRLSGNLAMGPRGAAPWYLEGPRTEKLTRFYCVVLLSLLEMMMMMTGVVMMTMGLLQDIWKDIWREAVH